MAKSKLTETERFLAALYANSPGGFVEVRSIPNDKSKVEEFSRRAFVSEYSSVSDIANDHRADDDTGLYFGIGKRTDATHGRKSNVTSLPALFADIDCANIHMDEDEAIKTLYALPGCLQPSALVRSGGGLHCYWFLDEPIYNQPSNVEFAENLNERLAEIVSGDSIGNFDRIFRIPGSVNSKRATKKSVHVVWCFHWARYSALELRRAADEFKWALGLSGKLVDPSTIVQDTGENAIAYLHRQAVENKSKRKNAPGLTAFDRAKPGGGVGYLGLDEAMTSYTAARFAQTAGSRNNISSDEFDQIVRDTCLRVREACARYGAHYDDRKEREKASEKLERFAGKWPKLKAEVQQEKKARKQAAQ